MTKKEIEKILDSLIMVRLNSIIVSDVYYIEQTEGEIIGILSSAESLGIITFSEFGKIFDYLLSSFIRLSERTDEEKIIDNIIYKNCY